MKWKKHMARVAELSCSVCQTAPVEVHHIRHPAVSGSGYKAGDAFTIPLCPPCHAHFHKIGREKWEMSNGSQFGHVEATLSRVYK